MLFGDREDFGVEVEVETDLLPPSAVWGHMCVWCRGGSVGNGDVPYCFLGVQVEHFVWLRDHLDELWHDRFAGLDDVAVFRLLDDLVYGDDDRTLEDLSADYNRFEKFDLTNAGESFNGWKLFIFCPVGADVHILFRHRDGPMKSAAVTRTGFTDAVTSLEQWFNDQERRLGSQDCVLKRKTIDE
jgi:hypothetical protein